MLYFYVPSVTDISCHVCAIQGSSKVLIYDLNNKINVPIEIVTSLAIIVYSLRWSRKFVIVFHYASRKLTLLSLANDNYPIIKQDTPYFKEYFFGTIERGTKILKIFVVEENE